jgi:hypothetical protein
MVKIHPYELSYYNELIGGPRGAWHAGFELSYWYDAFNDQALAEINRKLPPGASVDFLNEWTNPPTFAELQSLGHLRSDLVLGTPNPDEFPYVWLLTHDSKATPFTRLLFAMKPWYALRPRQLDGLRVATVADPVAVSRAWALQLLADAADRRRPKPPATPAFVRELAPWLGRFWGEGLSKARPLAVNDNLFDWAKSDPDGLRDAARTIASGKAVGEDANRSRLLAILRRYDQPGQPGGMFSARLLKARPEALVEAVEIVIAHPDAVRTVLMRYPYTDPDRIGGYLDR